MAYVTIGNIDYTVRKGKNDRYYYVKDGKRKYTRAKVKSGPKPKTIRKSRKTTRKSPKKTTRKSPKKTTRKSPKKTTRKSPKKTTRKSPKKTTRKSPKKTTRKSPKKPGCQPQRHLAKYTNRPGPPHPAQQCKNATKFGNDGHKYKSLPDKNGTYRWKKVS